jgi:RimJ/RimL family protein N-acetyltransferase
MENPFLVGERVYLRPVEPADADLLAACNNHPEVRVSFFTHTPTSRSLQARRAEEFYKPGADYIPLVVCVLEDDTPIGIAAFHRVDLVSRATVYSIIIAEPGQWRMGYGGEVTRLMLQYAFEILNLHRVQLHVWADNAPAIHVYEKAGFVKEGCLREAMCKEGKFYDFYVMGILEEEWRAQKANKKE